MDSAFLRTQIRAPERRVLRWAALLCLLGAAGHAETYTFYVNSSDSVRLWVNGQRLIDNWALQPTAADSSGTLTLLAGVRYSLQLDYFNLGHAATVHLSWSSPSQPRQVIPSSRSYPTNAPAAAPAITSALTAASRAQAAAKPIALSTNEPEPTLAEMLTNAAGLSSNALAETSLPPGLTPLITLEQTRISVHLYASMFGENPVGLNFEITHALNGHNPRRVNFIRPEAGMRLNEKGELVDPWGTPYFFHQLSRTQMEIRSAGPDRVMWTGDGLVVR